MTKSLLVTLLEVRSYLMDKGDLAFSLLLPIALFALIYGALGGQSLFHGTAHVVNEDRGGTYSSLLIERLDEVETLDIEQLSLQEADFRLERSDILMAVFIPEDFSEKLISGEPAQLTFKQRGNGGDEGQIVASIVRSVAEDISQEFRIKTQVETTLAGRDINQNHIEITVQKFLDREKESPLVAVRAKTVGTEIDPVSQFLPGIVTMFVLFAITLTARTIVEERKKGTLERLLTTQLTVGQLFGGKFLAGISRGFIQTVILLVLAYIVFHIFTPLSFGASLVIAIIFAAAVSAIGLVIASIARTEDQATWIAVFFTMFMVMVGGTFFEIPEGTVLATISKISINTYVNNAFNIIIVEKGSLADIGLELGILAGVAVVGFIISRTIFRVMPRGK